jgi:RNA polymerase sigma-70 factor (ECF subfamily)
MVESEPDTEELLGRVGRGDDGARQQLLDRHRARLMQMVALRLDRRLRPRLDPSDVVQEALMDANRDLSDYLRDRPLPFYLWLRQLTWQRLAKLHEHHQAGKRQVGREEPRLTDESALELAQRLLGSASSPSRQLLRKELRRRVQDAMGQLAERDREILELRYLEGLSTKETAAVLGIREGATKVRHLRALERLRGLLGDEFVEE